MTLHRRAVLATMGLAALIASIFAPAIAPATVTEQRQRLPPPAECDDPVEGVWRAHAFRPDRGSWFINTMELRWNEDRSKLLSKYENHHWSGGPDDSEPPACRAGLYRRKAYSTGEGSYVGGKLEVRGTKLGPDESVCGNTKFTRALGTLTGTLDREKNEFRSEMQSRFGSHPIIWRRIRCLEEPKAKLAPPPPPPPVPPPPPPPSPSRSPRSRGSCSCGEPGR